jgi:hypothetical protein
MSGQFYIQNGYTDEAPGVEQQGGAETDSRVADCNGYFDAGYLDCTVNGATR